MAVRKNNRVTEKKRQNRMRRRKISGKISRKLIGIFAVVILAMVGLAGRITYINATEGNAYKRIVMTQAQQQYASQTIPFQRGDITDRNGNILATSEKVYNIILDCKVVNSELEDSTGETVTPYVEPTVKALVRVLGMNENDVRDLLESDSTKNSQYQILKENVSISDKQKFEAYLDVDSEENKNLTDEEREARQNVKGVWFEQDYERTYPYDSQACDVIGFTYDGTTADWGIEGYYSDILNGTNGRQYGYYSADSDVEQTIIPATAGKNIVSTIDINVQQIIRSNLEDFIAQMSGGPYFGDKGAENIGVVVMDPNSGEILGMDSSDWYDLNDPRNLHDFYTDEEIEAMDDEEMMNALSEIWKNFCISDAYEPGSTVKPLTVAAALETGVISKDETFVCDGTEQVADKEIHCDAYPGSHGTITAQEAIKYSCNDALMQIAAKLGVTELLKYQDEYNLGKKTGIDLPGENSGILFTEDTMGPVELATTGFGQGFTMTMVQEAAAISSVINGGYYYKPHVVKEITDENGAVVQEIEPVLEGNPVSEEVSKTIREAMGEVVEDNGTGYRAKIAGYSMGGKTGTAETLPRGNGMYLLSFIGFAPLDDPQVLVYVVIDKPNSELQENSVYSTGLAKNIFLDLLPYLNIYPDEDGYTEDTIDTTKTVFNWEKYEQILNGTADEDDTDLDQDGLIDTWADFDGDGVNETRVDADGIVYPPDTGTSADGGSTENPYGQIDTGNTEYDETGADNGTNLPDPPEQEEDETVENGGNSLYSDGITNDNIWLTE